MTRLGIFVFYDKNGIVDRYIDYLLNNISENLNRLIIVCNGTISNDGRKSLQNYTTEIIVRENIDYDGGAYKYVFEKYLGKVEAEKYDEILMFNDTFFGPFYRFKHIFKKMKQKSYDFWGLSLHESFISNNEVKNKHIQSYFIVLTKKVISSISFWNFWYMMEHSNSFNDAVNNFELAFSNMLIENKFSYGAYYVNEKYISKNEKNNFDYLQLMIGEAIEKHKFPVFKWKCFFNQTIENDEANRALQYIYKKYKNYPFDYVWQTLFRKNDLPSINATFGLNHVFSGRRLPWNNKRLGVIWEISNIETLNLARDLINSKYIYRVVIITAHALFEYLKKEDFNVKDIIFEQLEETNAILYAKNNANVIDGCDMWGVFRDDESIISQSIVNRMLYRDYLYRQVMLNDTTLKYLYEILIFQPTIKIVYAQYRASKFEADIVKLRKQCDVLKQYLMEKEIRSDFVCETVMGKVNFWCETKILAQMVQLYDSINEHEWYLALPYMANYMDAGIVIIDNGKSHETAINEYMNIIVNKIKSDDYLTNLREQYLLKELQFIEQFIRNPKYYIYGCGKIASKNTEMLQKNNRDIMGYIVSDGEINIEFFNGKKVVFLSEFVQSNDSVIIVSVANQYLDIVMDNLHKAKIKNIVSV